MEDTLRDICKDADVKNFDSLNPCSNGRYSQRVKTFKKAALARCLNPCSNGRYSQRVLQPFTEM